MVPTLPQYHHRAKLRAVFAVYICVLAEYMDTMDNIYILQKKRYRPNLDVEELRKYTNSSRQELPAQLLLESLVSRSPSGHTPPKVIKPAHNSLDLL